MEPEGKLEPRSAPMGRVANPASLESLSREEHELLQELVNALRTIRFGSVALTVHEGRLVEIHKTEKIRRKAPAQ